jgi:hypothetical protein
LYQLHGLFPIENIEFIDLDFLNPNQLGNAYIAKFILKKVFGLDFDPDRYISDPINGVMFPEY